MRQHTMKKVVERYLPSPPMIVALVALFVALGGTAAARDAGSTKVVGAPVTVVRVSDWVQPGSRAARVAMCPRGYEATGGGAKEVFDHSNPGTYWDMEEAHGAIPGDETGHQFTQPGLSIAPRGWRAVMRNVGAHEGRFAVSVVCAKFVTNQR